MAALDAVLLNGDQHRNDFAPANADERSGGHVRVVGSECRVVVSGVPDTAGLASEALPSGTATYELLNTAGTAFADGDVVGWDGMQAVVGGTKFGVAVGDTAAGASRVTVRHEP